MVSQIFVTFLKQHHGPQWEFKFLRSEAEPLFDQMLAYIVGYAKLTTLNKRLLRRLFETSTTEEKAERLRLLAESGGFLEVE